MKERRRGGVEKEGAVAVGSVLDSGRKGCASESACEERWEAKVSKRSSLKRMNRSLDFRPFDASSSCCARSAWQQRRRRQRQRRDDENNGAALKSRRNRSETSGPSSLSRHRKARKHSFCQSHVVALHLKSLRGVSTSSEEDTEGKENVQRVINPHAHPSLDPEPNPFDPSTQHSSAGFSSVPYRDQIYSALTL
jgi:hypothetical protein